jgi:O-antigen ligase
MSDGRPEFEFARFLRGAAITVYIATLLWAPFPLGGAIRWAPSVQHILIAVSWVLWILATIHGPVLDRRYRRVLIVPFVLFGLTLGWAVVQTLPGVPSAWVHPVWGVAADALGKSLHGTISLNPWRTESEVVNLAGYIMAGWLAFHMARRVETAKLLLNVVIAITALYTLYAFALLFIDVQQVNVFYTVPYSSRLMSGSFMLHNSFATYCGLGALAAVAKLCNDGTHFIMAGRGLRRLAETTLQYCFGRGAFVLIALILCFAGVVASASRAGFVATMAGMITLALIAIVLSRGRAGRMWAGLGALAAVTPIIIILIFNGDTLANRLDQLLASDTADAIRFALWDSARRMIADAPLLGLGLGTFEDAYPLYAVQVFPHVMDKAHCDYLEFAAGVGLPAAVAWWGALLWLWGWNTRALFVRHRHRVFSSVAIGATVLVAVHSCVDFSLQLPAVSLSFATLFAIGTAQCLSEAKR